MIAVDIGWYTFNKLPEGIGAHTVNLCIEKGLVRTKRVDRMQSGEVESYRIALRITAKGKAVLQKISNASYSEPE
ncbi:MAG TPA: hypothetical protein VNG29_03070 [Candidatus Paceibacterota bacterium]|nr:hypothetical protein [Candidatus Paceibacterota bacterium]